MLHIHMWRGHEKYEAEDGACHALELDLWLPVTCSELSRMSFPLPSLSHMISTVFPKFKWTSSWDILYSNNLDPTKGTCSDSSVSFLPSKGDVRRLCPFSVPFLTRAWSFHLSPLSLGMEARVKTLTFSLVSEETLTLTFVSDFKLIAVLKLKNRIGAIISEIFFMFRRMSPLSLFLLLFYQY